MRLSMLVLVALDCACSLARSHPTKAVRVIVPASSDARDIGFNPR